MDQLTLEERTQEATTQRGTVKGLPANQSAAPAEQPSQDLAQAPSRDTAKLEIERSDLRAKREPWFGAAASQLVKLDDVELLIIGVLLWRAGYEGPGAWVQYAKDSLALGVGGQSGGRAQRKRIAAAGKRLEQGPLVKRYRKGDGPRTPYLWQLLAPTEPGPAPSWAGAYGLCRRLILAATDMPATERAALMRLALSLDGQGKVKARRREIQALVRVSTWDTARKRLDQLAGYKWAGLTWREKWSAEGRKEVALRLKPEVTAAELEAEAREVAGRLWAPELVKQLVEVAEQHAAGSKMDRQRKIAMGRQVVEFQLAFASPPLIKYALEETIKGPALRSPGSRGWQHYMRAILKRHADKYLGRGRGAGGAWTKADVGHHQTEQELRDLVARASDLNGMGKTEEARELLPAIEAGASAAADLCFDGDEVRALRALRLAFKEGHSDFGRDEPEGVGALDFWPEWDPATA